MYLALFLTPWMCMYALSSLAMNHRDSIRALYGGHPPEYEKESDAPYTGTFPADARPRDVALQILIDLGLDGAHSVRGRLSRGRLTIHRHDPITPRRITYTPADRNLLVERRAYRTSALLEGLHRRRGYQHDYFLEDAWGASVDLVIVAMVLWVASGLWMWWELKPTRRWGTACTAAGIVLFGLFLFTI